MEEAASKYFAVDRDGCLWRKQHPSILPLIVTVAYIPPQDKDKKNSAMRAQGLHAVSALVEHVKMMWHGSQHVVKAHVNAPDGCQMLKIKIKNVVPIVQIAAVPFFFGTTGVHGAARNVLF